MTEAEFIVKYRDKYLGLACYGAIHQQLPVADRDANIFKRCKDVEEILAKQYRDAVEGKVDKPLEAKPVANGAPTGSFKGVGK